MGPSVIFSIDIRSINMITEVYSLVNKADVANRLAFWEQFLKQSVRNEQEKSTGYYYNCIKHDERLKTLNDILMV